MPAIRLRNFVNWSWKRWKIGKKFLEGRGQKTFARNERGRGKEKRKKRGRSEVETERDLGRSAEETIQEDRDERRDWWMMIGIVGEALLWQRGPSFLPTRRTGTNKRESSGTSFVKGASPRQRPVYLPTWRRMNRQEREPTSVTVFTAPLASLIRIGPSVNEPQRRWSIRSNVESLFSSIEFYFHPFVDHTSPSILFG